MKSRVETLFETHPELQALDVVDARRTWIGFGHGGRIEVVVVGAGPMNYWDGVWRPIESELVKDLNGIRAPHLPYRVDVEGTEFWRGQSFMPYSIGEYGKEYRRIHRIGKPLIHGNRVIRPAGPFMFETEIDNVTIRDNLILDRLPEFGSPYVGIEYLGEFPKRCGKHLPFARDAIGREIILDVFREEGGVIFGVPMDWLADAIYPVYVDPDIETCNACWEQGQSTTYSTARLNCTSSAVCGFTHVLGQDLQGSIYVVRRIGIKFHLEGLNGTITDVTMDLAISSDDSGVDFDIEIVRADWANHQGCGFYSICNIYDKCRTGTLDAVLRNTSGIATEVIYTSPSLNTTYAQNHMNGGNFIYYGTRSSRDDTASAPSAREDVTLYCCYNVTYGPTLTLTGDFGVFSGHQPVVIPAYG